MTDLTGPELAEVPEFTIQTRYLSGAPDWEPDEDGTWAEVRGWRYHMTWHDDKIFRASARYGFSSERAAIDSAKRYAKEIARALVPARTTKYTPEI